MENKDNELTPKKTRVSRLFKLNKADGEIDYILFYTLILLVAIGAIMIYSASSYRAANELQDSMAYLKKQLVFVGIGSVSVIFFINWDYHKFKNGKLIAFLMVVTIILLLLVFLFPPINGAQRWIQLGPLSLQPSEMAKYVVVIYLAKSLDKKGDEIKSFWRGVFPTLLVAGIFAGLVLAEKNLSITSVIMFVAFILITISGARKRHLITLGGIGLMAGISLILAAPYRLKRLLSFLDPWADPRGDGYQLIQSLLALGSGGFLGLGFGMSRQKAYYLPEPHNDFIFSVIGEETGFLGCIIVISLFAILIWRGVIISIKCKDNFGTLLAMGITSVIAIQAIINLAVVTGTMPVTGVPLPFISYGGSSLLFNMTAMGILLNVSRNRAKW